MTQEKLYIAAEIIISPNPGLETVMALNSGTTQLHRTRNNRLKLCREEKNELQL